MSKSTAKDHARTIWCMRLGSALRTAFAAAIVGVTTLYGPKLLIDQTKFSALSYVIVILILSNNPTLGHALSGCWHALYATIQVVPLAVLGRWLIAPANRGGVPASVAAVVAAMASFVVVLPGSTHLMAKRIALGQIALICTEIVISTDDTTHEFMNPLHIAASTVLGALASLLALLLPFPGLAHFKVQKLCQVYSENASERMDIYLKALNAQDYQTKTELVLRAKPIAEMGTKLLQSIKILQEGLAWETPWRGYSRNKSANVENKLQSFELPIRAMEYSLISSPTFPVQILSDQEQLSNVSQCSLRSQLRHKIEETTRFVPPGPKKASQTRNNFMKHLSRPIPNYEFACFFLSCMEMLLLNDTPRNGEVRNEREKEKQSGIIPTLKFWILNDFKCSISLGLAVLFGLILERENACWAGLMVATSFAAGREKAIFTAANVRAQGTAIGSVYGVICSLLFHRPEIRLFAVLFWVVFATFLRHSKMYGQAGSVSAAIGALLILGRKDFGSPNEFAIGRLTSVFIGLFCLVLVELILQPTRAATLAKRHLYLTLLSLQELIKQTSFNYGKQRSEAISKFTELRERQTTLKSLVSDAETEPDFWYLPFHSCCYKKLLGSLSNVVNVLYVAMYNLEIVSELQDNGIGKEFEEQLSYELERLQRSVSSSLEETSLIESPGDSQSPIEDKFGDIEAGKLENFEKLRNLINEEVARTNEDERQVRMVGCLGAIGFCISSLRKEIDAVEICVREIVQWENYTSP